MNMADRATRLVRGDRDIWFGPGGNRISYPDHGNAACFLLEDDSYWFHHRNDGILSLVRRHPPQGGILDLGGGNGFVARRLLDEGFPATLLEPGPVGAANGKTRRHLPEVICSTLEDAGFPPGSVPAVGCFDVIEHVAADREFLGRIREVLIPGGMLYATVPAHPWLWSASDDLAGHCRRYDHRAIGRLLTPGFELLFFTYLFHLLTWPIFFLRALPYRLGAGRLLSEEASHRAGGGLGGPVLRYLLARELAVIDRGVPVVLGTSCLFAARKVGAG